MKKYDTVLFDLDGTLTDPSAGLVSSFKYALDKMGVQYGTTESLKRFIGPPLYAEWKRVFDFSDEEANRALLTFREFYAVYGWWDNKLYDGIHEMLGALKGAGLVLAVATSKPEVFAKKVLHLFDLDKYFDFIGAADTDRTRDKKNEVIEHVFANIGQEKRAHAVLVGDRKFDAEGAAMCGIKSIGVLYGHGSYEEMSASAFEALFEEPSEVVEYLK